MKRRDFHKTIISAAAITKSIQLKPAKKLMKGDRVGLIAPASKIDKQKLYRAVVNLETLGLEAVYDWDILAAEGYLAGNDEHRVKQIHEMYADESIAAIWCVRGGYGATRLLDQLDFELIRQNPKPLLGYSDVTALLNTIHQKTKSPCFHAQVACVPFSEYTIEQLQPIWGLSESFEVLPSKNNKKKGDAAYESYSIVEGSATGPLVGGNLSLIVSLIGTAHEIETDGKIVFIEDIGEHCYRIDRMVTQLISSGFFTGVKGIILGIFEDCTPEREGTQTLKEVLMDRLQPLGIPAAYGYSFGHLRDQMTLPIGSTVTINTRNHEFILQTDGY